MKLKIELSYKWSTLDKIHEFGIVMEGDYVDSIYMNWVWYHLGVYLGENNYKKYILFQFPVNTNDYAGKGKVLNKYKFCGNAKRQALLLANSINRRLNALK